MWKWTFHVSFYKITENENDQEPVTWSVASGQTDLAMTKKEICITSHSQLFYLLRLLCLNSKLKGLHFCIVLFFFKQGFVALIICLKMTLYNIMPIHAMQYICSFLTLGDLCGLTSFSSTLYPHSVLATSLRWRGAKRERDRVRRYEC